MDSADRLQAYAVWAEENGSRNILLRQIDAYLQVTGLKEETFGWRAVSDSGFVARLRKGGNCVLDRFDLCMYFIATSLNPVQVEMFHNLIRRK